MRSGYRRFVVDRLSAAVMTSPGAESPGLMSSGQCLSCGGRILNLRPLAKRAKHSKLDRNPTAGVT